MISIYTRSTSLLSKEFWKWVGRRLLGKYSGPNAVEDSLLRGLKELQIPFKRNGKAHDKDAAVVLSGVEALREVIMMKKSRQLSKLIAGPNVVASPLDENGLILSEGIDAVLVPSQWVADLWAEEAPQLTGKISIWPAGVAAAEASTRTGTPVIYDKIGDPSLLSLAQKTAGTKAKTFNYGSFKHKDYLAALSEAPYLIYLARSESQGLALQEAWARNVPTFVNKSTNWNSGKRNWRSPQINCPYLTPELGGVFADEAELARLVAQAVTFQPKKYCDEHLSDRASARLLLNIIHEKSN